MAGVQSTNSFYAKAKDEDGYVWNGRKAKATPRRSWDPDYYQGTSSGKWLGLPERAAWWIWFSAHYKDVVRPHLTGQIQGYTTGILYSFSETPVLEEQIRESLSCCHYLAAEEPHRQSPAP